MEYELLKSQIEGAFGHQSDEEGLPDFLQQLEFYPDLARQVLSGLRGLAEEGDPERCYDLVANYAHRAIDSQQEAVEWVQNLDQQVRQGLPS